MVIYLYLDLIRLRYEAKITLTRFVKIINLNITY